MARLTFVAVALVAGLVCVQAAGGIKGRQQQAEEGQLRAQGIKGPIARPPIQQQQVYLPPPPPPPSAPAPLAIALPVQQAIKAGPGQVAPVFTAARVQPPPPPPPAPIVQQQIVQQQVQQEQEPIVQQQQQQAEEIDPNAAAQDSAPAVIAPARAAPAASEEEANPRPEPYAFQYAFESGDSATSGSSTREEQQDASGRVTGFYTLKGEDGRDRRVDYVADASGFRATISTNELGTAPKDSADVDWNAQNPSEAQLRSAESATQAARARALANPQPIAASSQASASFGKFSSPRQKGAASSAAASSQQLSKANLNQQQQQQQQVQQQVQISQLQEPFEQIRQTELNTRARKSRHAPFYLFTV